MSEPTQRPRPRNFRVKREVVLHLELEILHRLREVARYRKMSYEDMLELFIKERLYEEERRWRIV